MKPSARLLAALLVLGAATPSLPASPAEPSNPAPSSKVAALLVAATPTPDQLDPSIRPQDDLFAFANHKWIASVAIPPDRPWWGVVPILREVSTLRQIELLEAAAQSSDPQTKAAGNLYQSFMDEQRIETLGAAPLAPEFERIAAIKTKAELLEEMVRLERIGVAGPIGMRVGADARSSTRNAVYLFQSGIGLPDRDYYLGSDAKLQSTLTAYREHVKALLALTGDANAALDADKVVALETAIATIQWTRVASRDRLKTYNPMTLDELAKAQSAIDWKAFGKAAGFADKVDSVIVVQPSYFSALATLVETTPLDDWRAYERWRLVAARARYLNRAVVEENFAFVGKTLTGTEANTSRSERGAALVSSAMGEVLGRLYVERYFPPAYKARIEALVVAIREAYREDIETLDWMDDTTRRAAQEKLAKLTVKLAYPEHWRDYAALAIDPRDLLGNVARASAFDYEYDLAKLGHPVDKTEWSTPPQTVNAFYNSTRNDITFPAAFLQPPVFDPDADDAVNFGAVGAVIGHEISHAFDDQGSHSDGEGNLVDWWSPADHERFEARTRALVDQYGQFDALPGFKVNGALTLGENIADLSGANIAFKAYRISLGGKPAPVIDGRSGEERFWIALATYFRGKYRDSFALVALKSDPHAPHAARVNGVVSNVDAFYTAFGVKPGDKLYRPPEERIHLW